MLPARDLNMKPSFVHELHALPAQMSRQIWEKIEFLVRDPLPDGHLKKKMEKWKDIYRLRIGDYRVFYSFGSDWIRLLAIRKRADAYSAGDVQYEAPALRPGDTDDAGIDDVLMDGSGHAPGWQPEQAPPPRGLPRPITAEWLRDLGIPAEAHSALLACKTEDDLLSASVEPRYLERVVDNLFPRPMSEVLQQPDLALFHTEDLVRYKEGDLIGFLLRLDQEQEGLVDWALRGPALIKGGPGTGKSTIALYRVRSLLEHAAQAGQPLPRILFTTYTVALTRFSEQLLQQLVRERMPQVRVETADAVAHRIVKQHEPVELITERGELEGRIGRLLAERVDRLPATVGNLRPGYLLDEIEWVIEGRNLRNADEYLQADRTGRGIALNENARRAVWGLYAAFSDALQRAGVCTLSRLRARALELVQSGVHGERYDAVIIDEAQDLTPATLSLLVSLARDPTGIYLTADASQSIYTRGFTWQQVHERLRFRGRAVNLRRNYRTTREIAEAAADFLRRSSAGDPDSLVARSSLTGPQPVLLGYNDEEEQWRFAADFIRQMSRHLRLRPGAAAMLVPSAAVAEQAESALTARGLPARYMRGSQLDLQAEAVKVLSLQSAKGLEFPMVVIAGLSEKQFPRLPANLDPAERQEELQAACRTLFVGMTRAMRGLLLLYPRRQPSPLIAELNEQYWYTGR